MANNFQCPNCGHKASAVTDSRPSRGTARRRRECKSCGHVFFTVEALHLPSGLIKAPAGFRWTGGVQSFEHRAMLKAAKFLLQEAKKV